MIYSFFGISKDYLVSAQRITYCLSIYTTFCNIDFHWVDSRPLVLFRLNNCSVSLVSQFLRSLIKHWNWWVWDFRVSVTWISNYARMSSIISEPLTAGRVLESDGDIWILHSSACFVSVVFLTRFFLCNCIITMISTTPTFPSIFISTTSDCLDNYY